MKYVGVVLVALVCQALLSARGSSVITHLNPTIIRDTSFSVEATTNEVGERFTVFYRTNGYTLDELLHARLDVCDGDRTIASAPVEKMWAAEGVRFEFSVAKAYLATSKFTIDEMAHSGKTPMPGFDRHWFYLSDFVTNGTGAASAEPPDAIDKLVAKLSGSHGLWVNGVVPRIDLPATAAIKEVLTKTFAMTGFDKGRVTDFEVIKQRQVTIEGPLPNIYTAVLLKTNLGRKIAVMQYSQMWWTHIYDAEGD